MQVVVIDATENPLEVISLAAGCCYGKNDVSYRRVESCYRLGHLSVFEHAHATFRIEGISRACSHQLVRHRMASYCQTSQRYCRIDTAGDDWYVTPPSILLSSMLDWYNDEMADDARAYQAALKDGIKPEDARYLLPEATKTNIVMTCNVRELFHILDMREDKAAQWEIRDLAKAMREACEGISDEWRELMGVRA